MDQHPLGDGQDREDGPMPDDPASTTSVGRHVRPTVGRVGRSLPGAIVGVLLVSAIALGASVRLTALSGGRSDGAPPTQTADGGTTDGSSDGDTTVDGGEAGTAPGSETGKATDGGAGIGDQPTTEPTPPPDTEPRTIAIALDLGDGKVRIE